jgi:hypothetical protein
MKRNSIYACAWLLLPGNTTTQADIDPRQLRIQATRYVPAL